MRIIGDVHGKTDKYLRIASAAKYSLQVGDMGFDYQHLEKLDPNFHKFIPGNHDNYDKLPNAHSLMDYGIWFSDVDIFYVRGAWSIDGCTGLWPNNRVQGIDWWADEEISNNGLADAIKLFEEMQPEIVVTHEAPIRMVQKLWNDGFLVKRFPVTRTSTAVALDIMFDSWKPKQWFFGHYHNDIEYQLDGCTFRCINELSYVDL